MCTVHTIVSFPWRRESRLHILLLYGLDSRLRGNDKRSLVLYVHQNRAYQPPESHRNSIQYM